MPVFCLDMIRIGACDRLVVINADTIHQHAGGHELAIKKEAMLGRYQQITLGKVRRDTIGEKTNGIAGLVIRQVGINLDGLPAHPSKLACRLDTRFPVPDRHDVTDAQIFDKDFPIWGANMRPREEAQKCQRIA